MRKPRACECYGRIPLGHDMFLLRPEISTFAEKYRQRHAAIDFPDYQSRTQQWEGVWTTRSESQDEEKQLGTNDHPRSEAGTHDAMRELR